jgi:hypothetical protein
MVKVKKTRMIIIGLFILMGILFNITVYFDNGGVQDSDFALSDLRVSLVDKAYASDTYSIWYCVYDPSYYCPIEGFPGEFIGYFN